MSVSEHLSDSVELDRAQCFLLYTTFCGDIEKTSHAANVRPVDILRIAEEEKWNEKLRSILELKKSNRPGDLERAISRALCYVQAHRFRLFVEKILNRLTGMSADEVEEYLFTKHSSKDGLAFKSLTTRALADLASAMEKSHAMCYLALNDGTQARLKREEQEEGPGSAGDLHAQIAAAMASVSQSTSPRAMLFDAQLAQGAQLAAEAVRPSNPIDIGNI